MNALLFDGLLGLAQRCIHQRRLLRAISDVMLAVDGGITHEPDYVAAAVDIECRQIAESLHREALRGRRIRRAGWRLGRRWRDPDTRVCVGCLLLLAVWIVAT